MCRFLNWAVLLDSRYATITPSLRCLDLHEDVAKLWVVKCLYGWFLSNLKATSMRVHQS